MPALSPSWPVVEKDLHLCRGYIVGALVVVPILHAIAYYKPEPIPIPLALGAAVVGRVVVLGERSTGAEEYAFALPQTRRALFATKAALAVGLALGVGLLSAAVGALEIGLEIARMLAWLVGPSNRYGLPSEAGYTLGKYGPDVLFLPLIGQALFVWLEVMIPRRLSHEVARLFAVGIPWIALFAGAFVVVRGLAPADPWLAVLVGTGVPAVLYAHALSRLVETEIA